MNVKLELEFVTIRDENLYCLLKLDYNNPKEKTMWLTLSPCPLCAKAIINSGIKKVIYKEEYRELKGLEILINAGIKVEKF